MTHSVRLAAVAITLAALTFLVASRTLAAQQVGAPPAAGTDCETIKQDIQQLQDELVRLSMEMEKLNDLLDQADKDLAKAQADLNNYSNSKLAQAVLGEEERQELLDATAKLLNLRSQLRQQFEGDASKMQAIEDEIADLLNKLANCAPSSSTDRKSVV